jgi:hypothetical protein
MTVAHGIYQDGKVDLDDTVDWPNGERVTVVTDRHPIGMNEADWPNTPEALADLLKRMAEFEPVEFTPEDEAEIAKAREEVRRVTLAAVRQQMGLPE